MKLLKTIVIFVFSTHVIFSQNTTRQDTLQAAKYFKKADALLEDRKLDSAIVYFEKALPLYKKTKVWERVAGCYNGISESYFEYSKYEESLKSAKVALNICNTYLDAYSLQKAKALDYIGLYYEFETFDYKATIEYYQKALSIRHKLVPENHLEIAKSYENLGFVNRKMANFTKALSYQRMALKIYTENLGNINSKVAAVHQNIAQVLQDRGEYNTALKSYIQALTIRMDLGKENDFNVAALFFNIGTIYEDKRQYEKAAYNIEKSIKLFSNIQGRGKVYIPYCYNSLGNIFYYQNRINQALSFYKKALTLQAGTKAENYYLISVLYNNLGSCYQKKELYEKATEYYEKSRNNKIKVFGKNHPSIATQYHNIGNILEIKKKHDEAINYYEKALEIRIRTQGENHPEVASSYNSLGDCYFELGLDKIALENYKKALDVFSVYSKKNHPELSRSYSNISKIFMREGNYKKAINYYNKALTSNLKLNFKSKSISNQFLDLEMALITINRKAKALKALYIQNNNINNLEKSITVFKKADTLLNLIKKINVQYEDRVDFGNRIKETYKGAIECHILLNEKRKKNKDLYQAFYYSEKSKSNILKDLLNNTNAKSFSELSSDLIILERDLRIDKAYYQSKVNEQLSSKEVDSSRLSRYENKLFDISRRQDSLVEVLENNYPKYHQLKYDNNVISVAEVQQKLDDKTTLLEFFTADSTTYAFTISKNKIAIKELSTPKLEEQVKEFQGAITKDYEAYKGISYNLYQTLVEPINKELVGNQLIIVPDGPLWHLNFDLLLTQEDPSNNPKNWPYLLKDYAISYANSATLLFRDSLEQESETNPLQECLAFSFSGEENTEIASTKVRLRSLRSVGVDLPGTREEIGAIANIVDGQYFYGSEATEQNFKQHAGAYNILHLALHGDVDNERPENSKLYFTKSKDTLEDNYLYSHELFALDIPAELTVLSACNTGTGKIAKGEGIMSLGNAFQYAGTKSLLLTNWEVSDETTPKIMEYFYRNLKDGKNKAEALQQAKLQFLNTTNEETNHPYYWGGFYLLGDTAVIELKNDSSKYWWIGFGVLALILVSLFWYRKKECFDQWSGIIMN
ncbi:CHAT domain-containing protein [uncultured Aquimarina sp.]|uniref:CHAT domain-containing protein n=1 Tax=uncultured Aquimarina sp. TaxID=575652 RepID=UPI00261CBC99|nr:CHAT domain-containing protein [uncultured Aquimarina sp.]